eukprot:TRINITY_DN12406_c0_g1_i2.p1 TRINITY_DN12406_c0_g1~~TRINITY_DN12406_c0_g1_i2.p1  ORF type:complete len:349 (-),score=72.36 TRINITY_DN12406_c0_g1_i2:155-1201(-)
MIPVATFNIRLDGQEADPSNHFTRRVHRLAGFLRETAPWAVGLQEPFSGQLLHLQSVLPARYAVIGDEARGHGAVDRADPRRHNDFQTGIIYDTDRLELLEHEHRWLSKSGAPHSKDWGSMGVRTCTAAAFRVRNTTVELVVLNTHLDVSSEEARKHQSTLVLELVRDWQRRWPAAILVVTGDFNSANGQTAHRNLVTPENSVQAPLKDSWDECSMNDSCASAEFAMTFHGWQGSVVNTYAARLVAFVAFSVHGSGIVLPHHIPTSFRELFRVLKHAWQQLREKDSHGVAGITAAMPVSLSRQHVDWVLFSAPEGRVCDPKMVYVGEVKDAAFSSDHFPVLALFQVAK